MPPLRPAPDAAPLFPREHGAWSMLAQSFFAALILARALSWTILPAAVAATATAPAAVATTAVATTPSAVATAAFSATTTPASLGVGNAGIGQTEWQMKIGQEWHDHHGQDRSNQPPHDLPHDLFLLSRCR